MLHADPKDLKLAQRRVESAICALGGYVKDVREQPEESPSTSPSSSSGKPPISGPSSIFRRRMDYGYQSHKSKSNTTNTIRTSTKNRNNYYRKLFHQRYFVGEHGISWAVEENPPVFVSADEDDSGPNRNILIGDGTRPEAATQHQTSQDQYLRSPHLDTDQISGDRILIDHPIAHRHAIWG